MSVVDRIPAAGSAETVGESLHLVAEPDNLINAATDVLAARHKVSHEDAANLLDQATELGRPLADVAREVVLIGLPTIGSQIELRAEVESEESADEAAVIASVATALLGRLVDIASLPDLLAVISELAVEVVPGCEAAGVTVFREGASTIVASVDNRARDVDQIQYRNGEGPYLQAAHTQRLVRIDDIASVRPDEAWACAALQFGFTASMSVPIATGTDTAATMSLFAGPSAGWSQKSVLAAQTLGDHAGSAIAIAHRLSPGI